MVRSNTPKPESCGRTVAVGDAARLLGVTAQTVRNLLDRGDLAGSRELINERHRWRIDLNSVYRAMEERAGRAGAVPSGVVVPFPSVQRDVDSHRGRDAMSEPEHDLLRDMAMRLAEAEARADLAEKRLRDYQDERIAALETVIAERTTAEKEVVAALAAGRQAQEHLERARAAERRATDAFVRAQPGSPS